MQAPAGLVYMRLHHNEVACLMMAGVVNSAWSGTTSRQKLPLASRAVQNRQASEGVRDLALWIKAMISVQSFVTGSE